MRRVPAAVVSIIGGAIVQKILVPHSRVRFSKVILYNNGRRRVRVEDENDDQPTGEGASNGLAEKSEGASNGLAEKSEAAGTYKFLTFRLVRQGRVQLRDVRVQVWRRSPEAARAPTRVGKG